MIRDIEEQLRLRRLSAIERLRELTPHRDGDAKAALADLEALVEAAKRMRHAAIPAETHGVARHSVEEFDEALRRVQGDA